MQIWTILYTGFHNWDLTLCSWFGLGGSCYQWLKTCMSQGPFPWQLFGQQSSVEVKSWSLACDRKNWAKMLNLQTLFYFSFSCQNVWNTLRGENLVGNPSYIMYYIIVACLHAIFILYLFGLLSETHTNWVMASSSSGAEFLGSCSQCSKVTFFLKVKHKGTSCEGKEGCVAYSAKFWTVVVHYMYINASFL